MKEKSAASHHWMTLIVGIFLEVSLSFLLILMRVIFRIIARGITRL